MSKDTARSWTALFDARNCGLFRVYDLIIDCFCQTKYHPDYISFVFLKNLSIFQSLDQFCRTNWRAP